jgi:hypothetical protein
MRLSTEQTPSAARPALAAWKLPPIVAAIAVPIVGGFYLGGPGLGMAIGALAAATILVAAARRAPLHPIVPPPPTDLRRHILIILGGPLEDGGAIESLVRTAGAADGEPSGPEILLLAPSRHRFLARWASDFGPGRDAAQRSLVLAVASLAKAGVGATARVGEEDPVQAAEDELRSFPATEVVLVAGAPGRDAAGDAAAADLEARLRVPLRRLRTGQALAEPLAERRVDGVDQGPVARVTPLRSAAVHHVGERDAGFRVGEPD